ncbi:TBC1 domain family member 10A-like [Anguilla anguilla]|uniref:TBC1 domain family member 10A-like n=1 Tax=Anguilla anguilla TaxID=7936 RepID=UPI0015A8EE5D|nr:TBC1 domain family member 10A-like [Anguilla anguilla]
MTEISALTPSPPGLGDPHSSPPLLPPSTPPPTPPPHPAAPADAPKQAPVPKSTLYGDPAVMPRAAVRENPAGRGSPSTPAETAAPPPPPPTANSAVPPCEGQGSPSPDLKAGPNLYPSVSVHQPSDPDAERRPPGTPPRPLPADVAPATAAAAEAPKAPDPHSPQPLASRAPWSPDPGAPGTPRAEPRCPPVLVVQEPAPAAPLFNPQRQPAPDTLSYLESASMMSGSRMSLSGLGDDSSSMGSDSELNGAVLKRTDKYGFLGGTQYTDGSDKEARVDVARQREMKWLEMFNNWDKWVSRRFQKVKLRCRKGIPSSLRARAWQLLSNSIELLESNQGKFEELERDQGDPKWLDIIEKDLHRQFPFHEMFAARGGHGQQDLFRILKAYTVYRPDEGYCQAQAPVAAVLLMHMPAEQAFWCLVQICEKYLPGYYSAGLEAIQLDGEIFFALLRRVCPMAYRHLKKFKIDPILYMTEWFMCIFSRTLPWSCVLRVWDMFFCEGVKVVFRVGLVLLKLTLGSVDKLKELQGMYETMEKLRNIPPESVREDVLITEVSTLPVTEALIERESGIQLRKWRESRGELSHPPGRRLHGTRAIHELKRRSDAIRSGGSFSFLGGPAPAPGPLRVSSSLLSLPGFRKSRAPFQVPAKRLPSFSSEAHPGFQPGGQGPSQNLARKPPSGLPPPRAQAQPQPQPCSDPPPESAPAPGPAAAKAPAPPQTLSPLPKIVSEQITPTIPSPTANNTPLPPSLPVGKGAPAAAATPTATGGGGEEEGKKKKRSKEDKKKEKEEEKHKARERKEKDRAEKDRQKKEKDKKKEKGGKKKEKEKEKGGGGGGGGGGGDPEEKSGAAAPGDLA